jgi:A/G-specific adenine glycosylase
MLGVTSSRSLLESSLTSWYGENARDLPWRAPDRTPWGVLVSEIMLQQTPVNRVLPVWRDWLDRWPTPADLAVEAPAAAIRAWGRLGYPRRALRLHSAATIIAERHRGEVPRSYDSLRALPGIGDYTAAAVAAFAFGERHAVLDTNVRRVLFRAITGSAVPPASTTAAERALAESMLPDGGPAAALWSVAAMELGALVCTARRPDCAACPLAGGCVWRAAGYPGSGAPSRRAQAWEGTDRQARGRLLAALRDASGPVARAQLDQLWPDAAQRERALAGLLSDGLVEATSAGYRLPV